MPEGSLGGGTGMNCYGYKGGTGTASRRVETAGHAYTVAAITQANFGDRRELTIAGHRVGPLLSDEDNPIENSWYAPAGAGSCITIIATDAPLLPGQCKALARRVPLGLARTGTTGSHYSGDLFLAFSATNVNALGIGTVDWRTGSALRSLEFVAWGCMDPFYEAVVQSVEEALLNVLVAAEARPAATATTAPPSR